MENKVCSKVKEKHFLSYTEFWVLFKIGQIDTSAKLDSFFVIFFHFAKVGKLEIWLKRKEEKIFQTAFF